ncbi:hypothetical protein KAI32_01645 [Candidatus Pacearchaeota archaeon]|nr:hypothetical protein [Candidatus Pacearchaeota archaeon]
MIDGERVDVCKIDYLNKTDHFEEYDISGANVNIDYSNDSLVLHSNVSTFNNLWVANSGEGTVSKIDTDLSKEVARYRTGPNGGGDSPSRTAVDVEGNVWVANRGGANTLVKIAGNIAECIDKSGDGVIQTSNDLDGSGKIEGDELLPWGDDECVILSVEHWPANARLRGLAIDLNGFVWIGAYNHYKYYKLYPNNGSLITAVSVTGRPYGAVMDKDGFLWSSGRGGNKIDKIDTNTNILVGDYIPGCGSSLYGIATDTQGNAWVGMYWPGQGLMKLNSTGETIGCYNYSESLGGTDIVRGVTVDNDGDIWYASSTTSYVYEFHPDTETYGCVLSVGGYLIGIAQDSKGYIWAIGYSSGIASKVDPNTCAVIETVAIGNKPYTYSDCTGNLLFQSITAGQTIFNFTNRWPGSEVNFSWISDSEENILIEYKSLGDEEWTEVPNLELFNVTSSRYSVKISLFRNEDGSSPIVRDIVLGSSCLLADGDPESFNYELDNNCNGIIDVDELMNNPDDECSPIDNFEECNNLTEHLSFVCAWNCSGTSCPPSSVNNGICLSCNDIPETCSGYNNEETCEIDPCQRARLYDCPVLNCYENESYNCFWNSDDNKCEFQGIFAGGLSCDYNSTVLQSCDGMNKNMITNFTSENSTDCPSQQKVVSCPLDIIGMSFFTMVNFILAIGLITLFYFGANFIKNNSE